MKLIKKKNILQKKLNILIMGFSFKENCPDIRNTQIINIYKKFKKLKFNVDVYDPIADKKNTKLEYNLNLINKPIKRKYHAVILAVAHDEFKKIKINEIRKFGKKNVIVYDVKNLFNYHEVDGSL